jgi:DNA segregation ATPase FtsK/SpoIIIE-like protein
VGICVFYPPFSDPAGPWVADKLRFLLGGGTYVFPLALLMVPALILAADATRIRRWWAILWLCVLLTSLFGGLFDDPAGRHVFGGIIGDSAATAGQSAMGGFYAVLLVVLALISMVAVGGRSVVQPALWLAGAAGSLVGVKVADWRERAAEARERAALEADEEVYEEEVEAPAPKRLRKKKEDSAAARRRAVIAAELEAADAPDGDSPLIVGEGGSPTLVLETSAHTDIAKPRSRRSKVDDIDTPSVRVAFSDEVERDEELAKALEQAAAGLTQDSGHVPMPESEAVMGDGRTGAPPVNHQASEASHNGERERAIVQKGVSTQDGTLTGEAPALPSKGQLEVFPSTQTGYTLPNMDLLRAAPPTIGEEKHLEARARTIERTLRSFNVEARCVNAVVGPRVTRYELKIGPGINVNKIHGLADNLALELAVKAVRIEAPIPGMSAVGIEVPNASPQLVTLRDILESPPSQQANHPLTVGLGRDIAGHPIVANLAKMPHLLVAGATGSGKSVCLNALIVSLLMRNAPDTLRLILIDPKRVEMTNYSEVPHLACPVVHDVNQAQSALKWVVAEMERRYRLLEVHRARNIDSFNALCSGRADTPVGQADTRTLGSTDALPFIVVIVDELADLMMLAGQTIEKLICRIAQLSRAVGIHLVVATQRPDVKVITGTIKANIPSRIAFAVVSQIDSRTILDGGGADKLLGSGDMLFAPIGENVPLRVQGCFLADDEIDRVVEWCKTQANAHYDDSITQFDLEDSGGDGSSPDGYGVTATDKDPLFNEAAGICQDTGRASTSYLQRRLKIGYNRAARIMEELEDAGVVSPPDVQGNRKVL